MPRDPNRNIKDLLNEFLKNAKFKPKLDGQAVKDAWSELFGENIANYTLDIRFKDGELQVKLSSASLREELMRGREQIIENLNRYLGRPLVTGLKLL